MCYNRGYGETESPSRLSGNENHESELAVTPAYLALNMLIIMEEE
jgi:hypothetical protein